MAAQNVMDTRPESKSAIFNRAPVRVDYKPSLNKKQSAKKQTNKQNKQKNKTKTAIKTKPKV